MAGIDQILNLGDHFGGPLEAVKPADILIGAEGPCCQSKAIHDRFLQKTTSRRVGAAVWGWSALPSSAKALVQWVKLPCRATAVFEEKR